MIKKLIYIISKFFNNHKDIEIWFIPSRITLLIIGIILSKFYIYPNIENLVFEFINSSKQINLNVQAIDVYIKNYFDLNIKSLTNEQKEVFRSLIFSCCSQHLGFELNIYVDDKMFAGFLHENIKDESFFDAMMKNHNEMLGNTTEIQFSYPKGYEDRVEAKIAKRLESEERGFSKEFQEAVERNKTRPSQTELVQQQKETVIIKYEKAPFYKNVDFYLGIATTIIGGVMLLGIVGFINR